MLKFLVPAASRYGSTAEIAWAFGDVLSRRGFDVSGTPSVEVAAVEEYDAAILGSALDMGHWLDPAKELHDGCSVASRGDFRNREEIKAWSSGMADELSARSPMVGRWLVGCPQTPLASVDGAILGGHPQVKRGSAHSRSRGNSHHRP